MKHTVEEITLKNGARGLLIDVPDATVMSTQFQFRAGNRYVRDKAIYETAHIMEHMAFGANEKYRSDHAYEQEFTKNGAYHNAYTSDYSMVYEAACADFEWDRILDLQRLAITMPRFNAEELEAEKGNVRSELTGYLNNHNRVLWSRMQQALGEDIWTDKQRLATIEAISLKDIREHHKRTHTSHNMRFIIAGKLTGRKGQIKEMLDQWELPEGERFAIPHETLASAKPLLIRRKECSNLIFGWSMILPREMTDAEGDAMSCLNHILTGTMSSRIFGAARKKGLAYGVFSDETTGFFDSAWDFGGQVNLETAEALFDIIVRELKRVLAGTISAEDLENAKSYALGRYQMGAQTVAQISGFYTGRYFADDVVRDYHGVPTAILAVTDEQIVRTAREFFQANTWALAGVSCGDKELLLRLQDKLEVLF
ncbi:MAG: pitrilysin family protein [Candidatus Saccharibacteria bacterium]|nr:pitrilysin family protein [Candidatus Saccharibacteria bacterium]